MPSTSFRRLLTRLSLLAGLPFLLFLLAGYKLFVRPNLSLPTKSDAVVVLAGASDERLPVAKSLIDQGIAPVLALTTTDTPGNADIDQLCETHAIDAPIVCYSPSQRNTRTEIHMLAQVIDDQHWQSVTVVTSRYHVTRASTLLRQCTNADFRMVASEPEFGVGEWLRRCVIELGGLAQAYWKPDCTSRI